MLRSASALLLVLFVLVGCNILTDFFGLQPKSVSLPSFSPVSGIYGTNIEVSISTEDTGAAIYYTIDDTNPGTGSLVYTTPIPVAGDGTSLTIKAIAVAEGFKDSDIETGEFAIDCYDLFAQALGSGTVTLNPNASTFPEGATVEITVQPNPGYFFRGWQNNWTSGFYSRANPLIHTVTEDINIFAYCDPVSWFPQGITTSMSTALVFVNGYMEYQLRTRITNVTGSTFTVYQFDVENQYGQVNATTSDQSLLGPVAPDGSINLTVAYAQNPAPTWIAKWYCEYQGYYFNIIGTF